MPWWAWTGSHLTAFGIGFIVGFFALAIAWAIAFRPDGVGRRRWGKWLRLR